MNGIANPSHPVRALCWMLMTLASFIGLAIAVRQLSPDYSAWQMLGIRSLFGIAVMTVLISHQNKHWFTSQALGKQVIRNTFHFAGQYLWFVGITLLPLADVFALEFTAPIWAALLAWGFLGERLTRARQVAIGCGVVGLLMIVKPGADVFQSGATVVILSAMMFACSMVMVKRLSRIDNAATILFYFCLIQMPFGMIPAIFDWTPLSLEAAPWMLVICVTGLTAHWGITKALQNADVMFIQPIDFMRVPLIAVVGFLLYGEQVDVWLLVGALIIFAGNTYNLRQEIRVQN